MIDEKEVLRAIVAMEDAVGEASKQEGWAFGVAQALIPGRNALYALGAKIVGDDLRFSGILDHEEEV